MSEKDIRKEQANIQAQQQELSAKLKALKAQKAKMCNHQPIGGKSQLVEVHSYNGPGLSSRERDALPAGTVICKNCFSIFAADAFSKDEVENAVSVIKSMFEQVKLMSKLSPDEQELMIEWYDSLDVLDNIVRYYLSMIDALGKGKGNGNNSGSRKVGGMGLSKDDFGNRGY